MRTMKKNGSHFEVSYNTWEKKNSPPPVRIEATVRGPRPESLDRRWNMGPRRDPMISGSRQLQTETRRIEARQQQPATGLHRTCPAAMPTNGVCAGESQSVRPLLSGRRGRPQMRPLVDEPNVARSCCFREVTAVVAVSLLCVEHPTPTLQASLQNQIGDFFPTTIAADRHHRTRPRPPNSRKLVRRQ